MCEKVEKIDGFIGRTFDTPKGGVLTVVGDNGLKSGKKMYHLTCSICSEDKELFPELFKCSKNHLIGSGSSKPTFPCGCSLIPKWSRIQMEIRVVRECLIRGYKFKGYLDWQGSRTKLILECLVDGNIWGTTNLDSFFQGFGCPECKKTSISKAKRKPDTEMIRILMDTNYFKAGTIFTRNLIRKNSEGNCIYWDMFCPTCAEDIYTEKGLCTGNFTSAYYSFKKGYLPCRCNTHNYRWTKDQVEYNIRQICSDENITFLGWVEEEYKGNTSKFRWVCNEGHTCLTSVVNFIINGDRCATCATNTPSNGNGFYKEKEDEKDCLYIMDFLVSTKVGRSFEIRRRQGELKRASGMVELPEVLQLYTSTHKVVFDIEQLILKKLRDKGFQYYCDFTNECFTKDCWYVLQEILKDYVESGILLKVK